MATNNATNTSNPITVAQGGSGRSTLTNHSVQVGASTANVTQLAVGSNGQVLIGSTAADPAFATLSSSGSSITYTTGANTLGLAVTNPVRVVNTSNVGSGPGTLVLSTTDNENTGFGWQVLASLNGGSYNAAFGGGALNASVSDQFNTAVGITALGSLHGSAGNSNNNTAIGQNAFQQLPSGQQNTAVGKDSGGQFASGTASGNTLLGYRAGYNYTTTESNNIIIGNLGTISDSAVIRIGSATQTSCYVAGIAGVTVASSAAVLINTSTGQMGTLISSLRYKENIQDMLDDSSLILNLRPVTFNFKKDESHEKQFGLIAEEVYEIMPGLVIKNNEGQVETVKYHELVPMLLNELIKLKSEVKLLKKS